MMGDMKGLPLPGEPEDAEYVRTDTGSYWDVYSMARRILGGCLSTLEEAGWGTVGKLHSVSLLTVPTSMYHSMRRRGGRTGHI